MVATGEFSRRLAKHVVRGCRTALGYGETLARRKIEHPATPRLALERWIDELADAPPVRGTVAVLALRNPTWIEWAVYTACWMRKLGYAPALLYSRADVERWYGGRGLVGELVDRLHDGSYWALVARIPDVALVEMDAYRPSSEAQARYEEFAREYAPTAAAYEARAEEHDPDPSAASEYGQLRGEFEGSLKRTGATVEQILRELAARGEREGRPLRRVLAYSGLIGDTSAVLEAARRTGVSSGCVEGWGWRRGHMICAIDRATFELDMRTWIDATEQGAAATEAKAEDLLAYQRSGALPAAWLKTFHNVQRASVDTPFPPEVEAFLAGGSRPVLLATNVIGDSTTLRRATVFKSQRDWIESVVAYFRARPERRLIIRAHPGEVWMGGKVRTPMGELAKRYVGDAPNILVIDAAQKVNVQKLFPLVAGGLVWTSNVGVDMTILGLPVIIAARAMYRDLGFVHNPATRDEYFGELERILAGDRLPSAEQTRRAKRYNGIIFSEFSYRAFGQDFRGRDITLDARVEGPECETFYKILAGDLPLASRPAPAAERRS